MKILRLSSYYEPERVSSSHLSDDLDEALIKNGWTIENFVPTPTRGVSKEVRQKYKKIKYETKYNNQLIIHRFSMFSEGVKPIQRAVRYFLVNCIQYVKGSHAKGVDILYSGSTPPTQGILCGMVKRRLKIPYIYNLQDVFPDSLVNAKMTKKGSFVWRVGRRIEDWIYANADIIIVISDDIKTNIMSKGVPESKIEVIPNWVDCEAIKPVSRKDNRLFDEYNISREKFIVTYAGNMGTAQGIDTIFEAARLLEKYDNIEFVLFGAGINREKYETLAKQRKNISVFSILPADRISEVYSMGDISIVSCKKYVGGGALPSKSLSIMATATPIMLNFDDNTELWKLISDNNCGYTSVAEDYEALSHEIEYAMKNQGELKMKGISARKVVETHYSKNECVNRYLQLFERIANSRKRNDE